MVTRRATRGQKRGPGDEQSDRRVEAAKGWRDPLLFLIHCPPLALTLLVHGGWWDLRPQGEEAGVGGDGDGDDIQGNDGRESTQAGERVAGEEREEGRGPSYRVV